jgi:purine-binding chemotaxis protein CheW
VTLSILFGLEAPSGTKEADAYRHLMLIDRLSASGPAALLVDRVLDLVTVEPGRLSPVPSSDTLNGCIEAEIEFDGSLVHLLSLERILLAEERQSLAELGRKAQARLSEWVVEA